MPYRGRKGGSVRRVDPGVSEQPLLTPRLDPACRRFEVVGDAIAVAEGHGLATCLQMASAHVRAALEDLPLSLIHI